MALSEVALCNRALAAIGAGNEIIYLTEDTPEAEVCRLFYSDLRDAVLRDGNWGFAIKRAELNVTNAQAPAFGFDYAYQMPNDFMRMLEVYNSFNQPVYEPDMWSIEQGEFLSNDEAPIRIRYVSRVTDVTMYPQDFQEAVIYRLASEICEALENNSSLRAELVAMYEKRLLDAKHNGSIERAPNRLIYQGSVNRARYGGRFSGIRR